MSADSDFFDLESTKQELKIRAVDSNDDDRLNTLGEQANRILQNELAPYLNAVPLTASSTPAISNDMKNAVKWLVCSFYKADMPERSLHYMTLYKMVRDSIITALKTTPSTNTRNKFVVVASTYQSEPLQSRDS
jgi:hypothetical protein